MTYRSLKNEIRALATETPIEWVCLQIEVARNIEKGEPTRYDGPTTLVLARICRQRQAQGARCPALAVAPDKEGRWAANTDTLTDTLRELHRASQTVRDNRKPV